MSSSRSRLGYMMGVAGVGVMAFLVALQDPQHGLVVSPMLAAVMLAAYIGGIKPGLVATAVAALAVAYIAPPTGRFDIEHPHQIAQVVSLLALGIGLSTTMQALHRASRAEHRAAERFAQLFRLSPLPTTLMRLRDCRILDVNAAYLEVFGLTAEQVIGRTPRESGIAVSEEMREEIYNAVSSGRLDQLELDVCRPDGKTASMILSGQLTELDGEQLMLLSCMDVTEWRRAETTANAAGKQLHELAELMDASFWVVDVATGDVLYVSPGYERVWGRTRQEYMDNSQGWINAVHPDDRIRVVEALARGEVKSEFRIVKPDGSIRWLSDRMVEIRNDAGELVRLAGISEDITARKEAEAKAFASEELFRSFATAIDEVIWMVDAKSHSVLYVSPSYEKVFGRPARDLHTSIEAWADAVHAEDRARVVESLRGVPVSAGAIERFRIARPDGAMRWIDMKVFAVRDERGEITRIAGISRDVTEMLDVQQKLQQAQKLESVGMLAGGIAHDFNNILCVITGNAEMLGADLPADHGARAALDEIQLATERATSLTRQLLAFSRKQIVKPVVLDVNRTVDDARRMLRRVLGEDIALHVALDPEVGPIRIDPAQLTQVLMNLCVNARDAIGTSGTISIETRAGHDEALIIVHDTGHGMTEDVKKHVFEPFFTTKEVGRGTGLGLAVVHGIIEQGGGTIEVESELGHGTTFRIRIPVVASAASAKRSGRIEMVPGRESILVVDDDQHVRGAASRALQRLGYKVTEACDGLDALRIIRNKALHIDLIVTDVVMPNMGGRELAEHAARERADVPVLYLSGYTDDEVVQRGVEHHQVLFLQKPFRTQALAQKIREILDGRSSTAKIPVLRTRRSSSLMH